jgi:hypothetical protein
MMCIITVLLPESSDLACNMISVKRSSTHSPSWDLSHIRAFCNNLYSMDSDSLYEGSAYTNRNREEPNTAVEWVALLLDVL